MTQPLLSILVPLTPDRREVYNLLRDEVIGQIFQLDVVDKVQFTFLEDEKVMPIGEKREKLYQMAVGAYSWQIDSDDMIAANAIKKILKAIKENPDCITFEELCLINGKTYYSNHSIKYDDWEGDGQGLFPDGFHFHRTPFFKSVIRTDIARSVPIPHIRYGEDHAFARALKLHLKNEIHIPEYIYHYIHNSKPEEFSERYGFDKQ